MFNALIGLVLVGASSFQGEMKFAVLISLLAAPAFAWEASSPYEENPDGGALGNTHLFIVNRALDLLRANDDEISKRAVAEVEACGDTWKDALADTDSLPAFGDSQHFGAHFYNPTPDDDCPTFRFFGCQTQFSNARANAELMVFHIREGHSNVERGVYGFSDATRCYALGLALHFMTDSTMPFHAHGFSGAQVPVMLHPTFEAEVPRFQAFFVERKWQPPPATMTTDAVLVAASIEAKSFFPELFAALKQSRGVCLYSPVPGTLYLGKCFKNDARVKAVTGDALMAAQRHTADWLYALFRDQPKLHLAP
jgi:hypothetical protein